MMTSVRITLLTCAVLSIASARAGDLNSKVLAMIQKMPQAGLYASSIEQKYQVVRDLNSAISVLPENGKLRSILNIDLKLAPGPSFCSSAIPLVLFKVFEGVQKSGNFEYLKNESLNQAIDDIGSPEDVIGGKLDGRGIFGHLNADGPGLARLFKKLNLGTNFMPHSKADYSNAKPGDFMKIFWNEFIGRGEKGHLVIYLGESKDKSKIQIWSSNLTNTDGGSGYGTIWVDKTRIVRAVFSRLEHPENFLNWITLPESEKDDAYLISLGTRSSTEAEMRDAVL